VGSEELKAGVDSPREAARRAHSCHTWHTHREVNETHDPTKVSPRR
jgi:hypothetical protein